MANERLGAVLGEIERLFSGGTLGGLSDADLLRRFVDLRDEAAFETLVGRHGPMILATCQRVLDDPGDLEDAFQAVLLIFVRRAGTLWVDASLCGWLHEVACRVALQANTDAASRRWHERKAIAKTTKPEAGTEASGLGLLLHQEVDRLPEKLRTPMVLCYFEGLSYRQAIGHLQYSEGTLRGRLARARALLRARLARRGVILAAVLPAMTPPPLPRTARFQSMISLASRIEAGSEASAGTAGALALAGPVLRGMRLARLALAGAVLVTVASLGGVMVDRALGSQDPVPHVLPGSAPAMRPSTPGQAERPKLPLLLDFQATAGQGSLLPYVVNAAQKRIIDEGMRGAPFSGKAQERPWVVLAGCFDTPAFDASRPKPVRQTGGPETDALRLASLNLVRQTRNSDGTWSAWSHVDHLKTLRVRERPTVVDDKFLPFMIHPNLRVDPFPYDEDRSNQAAKPPLPLPIFKRGLRPGRKSLDVIVVHQFDLTVEPGRTYRYRGAWVRLDRDLAGRESRTTGPWSEPTNEVSISATR